MGECKVFFCTGLLPTPLRACAASPGWRVHPAKLNVDIVNRNCDIAPGSKASHNRHYNKPGGN